MSDKKIEQRCGKQPVGAADAILYHSRYTKVIIFIGEYSCMHILSIWVTELIYGVKSLENCL